MNLIRSANSIEGNRVLILSNHNIQNIIFNSCLYEFEDTIAQIDTVDIIAPNEYDLYGKTIKRLIKNKFNGFKSIVNLNPYRKSIQLEREYDIFLFILDFPWSISSLNLLSNWRNKCKFAACYLIELWEQDLKQYRSCLDFLQNFDFLFLGHSQIVEAVSNIIDRPCQYLPPAIDTIKFKPDFSNNYRCIDLSSMGRRSQVTHQALLNLAERQNFFYYYDLTGNSNLKLPNGTSHQTHRTLNANILKHSRYFITNNAKVNLPQTIQKQTEIGYRFFEGTASGTVMLGNPPTNEAFKKYFDWQDAIIPMAFDEPNVGEVIANLDAQPERLEQIRRDNVANSLLRHDWVYRWQDILAKTGLNPTSETIERQNHLQELALSLQPSSASYC